LKDRVSTQVLGNGAIRYGIYNADGSLNRYEYIKAEDAPTEEGDVLNKANLLPDTLCTILGIPITSVPKDALTALTTLANAKAQVATGSYTGTGSGSVVINTTGIPKIVIIAGESFNVVPATPVIFINPATNVWANAQSYYTKYACSWTASSLTIPTPSGQYPGYIDGSGSGGDGTYPNSQKLNVAGTSYKWAVITG